MEESDGDERGRRRGRRSSFGVEGDLVRVACRGLPLVSYERAESLLEQAVAVPVETCKIMQA